MSWVKSCHVVGLISVLCVAIVQAGVLYPYGIEVGDSITGRYTSWSSQLNISFHIPYYGSIYDLLHVNADGHVAFAEPRQTLTTWPPELPNTGWPTNLDTAFIAPFYSKVGFRDKEPRSNVWYRAVSRHKQGHQHNIDNSTEDIDLLLDTISNDVGSSVTGGVGFTGQHAVLVTWDNVTFAGVNGFTFINGVPKPKPEEEIPRNSFQMVIITDEVKTYVFFNYADINWVSCPEYGADPNFGIQGIAATIGFYGGNGTSWYPVLPYNQMQVAVNLDIVGVHTGRRVYRVDEQIVSGECYKTSTGDIVLSPDSGSMLGGQLLYVSGPCLESTDAIMCRFQEHDEDSSMYEVTGQYVSEAVARCVSPKFMGPGRVRVDLSTDGGHSYRYTFGQFYVTTPPQVDGNVQLLNYNEQWMYSAPNLLQVKWDAMNLTQNSENFANIQLWGYKPGSEGESWSMQRITTLQEYSSNDGEYSIVPDQISRPVEGLLPVYRVGLIRVSVQDKEQLGHMWSRPFPISWYYSQQYAQLHGNEWPAALCKSWHDSDRQQPVFLPYLARCPCSQQQALADIGSWIPDPRCVDSSSCPQGLSLCVLCTKTTAQGSGQQCCYDSDGRLALESKLTGLKQPVGRPARAHPTLDYWHTDLVPYYYCCRWSHPIMDVKHLDQDICQLYSHLRPADACNNYKPPTTAMVYGDPHFFTFDGLKYSTQIKGEFSLVETLATSNKKLHIQGRFEGSNMTDLGRWSHGTVMTAIAMKGGDSDIIELRLRKSGYRWRYGMDVLVNGQSVYFDRADLRYQHLARRSGAIFSSPGNVKQSDITVTFTDGAYVRVRAIAGTLQATIYLNHRYYDKVQGLLGTWTGSIYDDLTKPNGDVLTPPLDILENQEEIAEFGKQWALRYLDSLFTYESHLDTSYYYDPDFQYLTNLQINVDDMKRVCGPIYNERCVYDYLANGDEILAIAAVTVEDDYLQMVKDLNDYNFG